MAATRQLIQDVGLDARLGPYAAWIRGMRRKRAWEMFRVEHRRIDGRLEVVPEHGMRNEELERPLVLLIASGSAEGDTWFTVP